MTATYTCDGQHTTTYCTGWANGYTSTWNGGGSSFTNPGYNNGGNPNGNTQDLKDRFCNFVHSGDGTAASALVTLLGYGTVAAAA